MRSPHSGKHWKKAGTSSPPAPTVNTCAEEKSTRQGVAINRIFLHLSAQMNKEEELWLCPSSKSKEQVNFEQVNLPFTKWSVLDIGRAQNFCFPPEAELQAHTLLSEWLFLLSPAASLTLSQLSTSNNCNIKTCFSKQECTWLGETTGKERLRGKVFDSLPFSDSQHTISIHVIFLAQQTNNFLWLNK